jgi:RHS repeat-associated protein
MTTGGKSYYYLTDALGSVLAMADETGTKVNEYRYSPRGVDGTFTEKIPQPYRFAGGYQDPTGLYHLKARYYDPRIGRFTSPDPSGQEKNPYLYAEGDPVNRIDPSGLASEGWNLEVCAFGGCIGGGLSRNDDGALHASISGGAGTPGVSGGYETSASDASEGWTGEVECSAGNYRASVSSQGETSAGASTSYSAKPGCSAKIKKTF